MSTTPNNSPHDEQFSEVSPSAFPAADELTVVDLAEMDEADLRALIQQQVEEERTERLQQTFKDHPNKEGAPKRLRDDLEVPPRQEEYWKVLHKPEKRGPRVERLLDAVRKNQFGDAELLIHLIGDSFCFDHARNQFMRFEHSHWKPDTIKQHRQEVVKLADHFERAALQQLDLYEVANTKVELDFKDLTKKEKEESPEYKTAKKKAAKFYSNKVLLDKRANALRGDRRISGVINMATSGRNTLGMDGEEWDEEHTLLPCKNGMIDLKTGHLLPPDPKYKMRYASPYEYKGLHEEAPFWTDMLLKVFCYDMELLDYFERVIGYAATGLVSHKELYIAVGPRGDNAKSSVFETIMKGLGGYASVLNKSVLLQSNAKSTGPDPELLVVDGPRMVVASEPDQGERFNKEAIKQITGSDRIRTRGLYMDTIEFMPRCKLFLHTNFMPHIKGADAAFFRRVRLIPFNAKFTNDESEVDESRFIYKAIDSQTVKDTLNAEASGILAWIVRCARKFLSDLSLKPPLKVLHEVEDYKADMDPIGEWLKDWCHEDPTDQNLKTQAKDLYQSFCCYCKEELKMEEKYIINNRTFGDQMKQHFTRKKTNKVYYFGIEILPGCTAEERAEKNKS